MLSNTRAHVQTTRARAARAWRDRDAPARVPRARLDVHLLKQRARATSNKEQGRIRILSLYPT